MPGFTWVLIAADGRELRSTDDFASKEEAEAWMGSEWSVLLEEGAEYVSLRENGDQHYRMSLREA